MFFHSMGLREGDYSYIASGMVFGSPKMKTSISSRTGKETTYCEVTISLDKRIIGDEDTSNLLHVRFYGKRAAKLYTDLRMKDFVLVTGTINEQNMDAMFRQRRSGTALGEAVIPLNTMYSMLSEYNDKLRYAASLQKQVRKGIDYAGQPPDTDVDF